MIVDLVRNDLGRVCALGTVEVPALMAVESYATVHQLVTTVRGRLRDGRDRGRLRPRDVPGRVDDRRAEAAHDGDHRPPRAWAARRLLRRARRFLSVNGTADLSIVIRTLVASRAGLQIGAGGAIVAASDPDAEHEEMLLKARAVLAAVGGTLVDDRELAGARTDEPATTSGTRSRTSGAALRANGTSARIRCEHPFPGIRSSGNRKEESPSGRRP